jgi:hypothetical protein
LRLRGVRWSFGSERAIGRRQPALVREPDHGAPAPELSGSLASAEVIQVPVTRIDAESTTQLPDFDLLGSADTLVGVSNTGEVSTPSVVARIKAGDIAQFEGERSLSTEQVIATAPAPGTCTRATPRPGRSR